jgi:hypothetical protein
MLFTDAPTGRTVKGDGFADDNTNEIGNPNQSNQTNKPTSPGAPTNRAIAFHCHHFLHSRRKVLFKNEVKKASEKSELFNRKKDFRLNALNCRLQFRPKELSIMTPFSFKIPSKHCKGH